MTSKSTNTRRLYRFEAEWFYGQPLLPMKDLQKVAQKIWKEAGRSGHYLFDKVMPMPAVIAGKGTRYNGRYYSYYDPDSNKIVLARNERKMFVLIHEMVHALGFNDHDEKFVDKYFDLLDHYKVSSRECLEVVSESYGIGR